MVACIDCAIGDNVHCPYFNKGIEGANKIVKGRDMDLFSRIVKKGKAKEFPWASLVGVFMDGCLRKYATLDGPFFVVGVECFEWNYSSFPIQTLLCTNNEPYSCKSVEYNLFL